MVWQFNDFEPRKGRRIAGLDANGAHCVIRQAGNRCGHAGARINDDAHRTASFAQPDRQPWIIGNDSTGADDDSIHACTDAVEMLER